MKKGSSHGQAVGNAKSVSLKGGLNGGEGCANLKTSRLNKGGDTAFRGTRKGGKK